MPSESSTQLTSLGESNRLPEENLDQKTSVEAFNSSLGKMKVYTGEDAKRLLDPKLFDMLELLWYSGKRGTILYKIEDLMKKWEIGEENRQTFIGLLEALDKLGWHKYHLDSGVEILCKFKDKTTIELDYSNLRHLFVGM